MSNESNPVGFIQEICQKHRFAFPEYEYVNACGPDHCKEFTVKCTFEGVTVTGSSRQKKQAKSEAAKALISLLKEQGFFEKLNVKKVPSDDVDHVDVLSGENVSDWESKNPISLLNEYCQQHSLPKPTFEEATAEDGLFICKCSLIKHKTYGDGTNKKSAKTKAALKMCMEMNINCQSMDKLLINEQNEDSNEGKNPVSALQEFWTRNSCYGNLEYSELPMLKNLFRVKCTLNSISCIGSGTTKKIAKTQAASLVLAKVLAQHGNDLQENGDVIQQQSVTFSKQKLATVKTLSETEVNISHRLEDLNLDSSEDEKENEDSSGNESSKEMDLNAKKLEDPSLSNQDETIQAQEKPGKTVSPVKI